MVGNPNPTHHVYLCCLSWPAVRLATLRSGCPHAEQYSAHSAPGMVRTAALPTASPSHTYPCLESLHLGTIQTQGRVGAAEKRTFFFAPSPTAASNERGQWQDGLPPPLAALPKITAAGGLEVRQLWSCSHSTGSLRILPCVTKEVRKQQWRWGNTIVRTSLLFDIFSLV